MALPKKAKLPMALSFVMGVCILVADGLVVIGLFRQHADIAQKILAIIFAVLVLGIAIRGYYCSWGYLAEYADEEEALSDNTEVLQALVDAVKEHVKDGKWDAPKSLRANTPLFNRRVKHTWATLQRGAPLLSGDMTESEDRHFPGPERELRTYMDVALNVGIAGTFVSILITLGQPQGLTAETLLAHVGPGMTSGLAAVIANIGLRICHRALQDEQDTLAEQVDKTVQDNFIFRLPKAITSPEERLAIATENLANRTQEALNDQNTATKEALSKQASQFDFVLKEYARQIGNILTQQVQQPVREIAEHLGTMTAHTGALAQHSATWAETVNDLRNAHTAFLNTQENAQNLHEKRLEDLFTQYREGMEGFLQTAQQSNTDSMQATQEFTHQLLAAHTQALTGMTEHLRTQFITLQTDQEIAHRRMTETALVAVGDAVAVRIASIEERFAELITTVQRRLPETLRDGVRDGLSETVSLVDTVREEAAGLAHAIAQISGNADRQLQAYERWQDRALEVQGRLEQVVSDGQVAQAALLVRWQAEATQTLDNVRAAFDVTAREAQSGFSGLASALDPLTEALQSLQSTTQELQGVLSVLPSQVAEARLALAETAPSLRDTVTACNNIQTIWEALRTTTAVLLDKAQYVQEDAQRQSQETTKELAFLTQAIGGAAIQMDRAASAFAVAASQTPVMSNGHTHSSVPSITSPAGE